MRVAIVPCLADNYAYVVWGPDRGAAVVIDPSEAGPVEAVLDREDSTLAAILATHHHYDHVGGIQRLAARWPGVPVFGHEREAQRTPGLNRPLSGDERFDIAGLTFEAIHVPGHTLGALAYAVGGAVFTGDTLFSGGCGRLFEGSADQMFASLGRLASLPPETLVYPGHEYTAQNLRFASQIEPGNADLAAKLRRVEELRAAGAPSVPSTLLEERMTNPFLRVSSREIRAHFSGALGSAPDAVVVFAALRRAKDGWR